MCITHLVAKSGVAAADALFVTWAHAKTHDAVEARGTSALVSASASAGAGADVNVRAWWGGTRRVVVKIKVDGRGAADVGVAAVGVLLDGLWGIEREERQGCARALLGALHLQDYPNRPTRNVRFC